MRKLEGPLSKVAVVVSVIFILFHVADVVQVFMVLDFVLTPLQARAISLGFVLSLTFLRYPARKNAAKEVPWYDILMILMAVAGTAYIFIVGPMVAGGRAYATNMDCFFAAILFIPLLEAMRRTGATVVIIIGVLFVLYAYNANHLDGFLWGPGWGVRRLVAFLFISVDGFYGMAMSVFTQILVPFLVFAAFVRATGVGDFFIKVALSMAGWVRGGPAKVAVVSSTLFGMICGSAMANVASTGTFTIPMMKKTGFKPETAAAIEASSSTGGQIMPPIMGAAAFLMADFLGVSYWTIAKSAAIPAISYYILLWFSVDLEAIKVNAKGLPREELPSFWKVMKSEWYCIIPIVGLITALGVFSWRAEMCAILGIGLSILVSFARKETILWPRKFVRVVEEGADSALGIGALCAGLGMIIGICGLTGLGVNLSDALINLCRGNVVALLFATAIAAIILGMGMPTAGVYLFCVLTLAPALIKLGITPMAAHMFIFYFGLAGLITPPVALAAYTAAPIAGASPFATGWQACKFSSSLYVVPFIFVHYTGLLFMGGYQSIITACLVTLSVFVSLFASVHGFTVFRFIGWVPRILYFVSFCLLFYPKTALPGFILCVVLCLYSGWTVRFKLYKLT